MEFFKLAVQNAPLAVVGAFVFYMLMKRLLPVMVGHPLNQKQSFYVVIFGGILVFLALIAFLITYAYTNSKPKEFPPVPLDNVNLDISDASFYDYEADARAPRLDLKITNIGDRSAFVKKIRVHVKKMFHLHPTRGVMETSVIVPPEHTYTFKLLPADRPYDVEMNISHGFKKDEFGRFTIQFQEEAWPNSYSIYLLSVELLANSDDESFETKDLIFLTTQYGTSFPDRRRVVEVTNSLLKHGHRDEAAEVRKTALRNRKVLQEVARIPAVRNKALETMIRQEEASDVN